MVGVKIFRDADGVFELLKSMRFTDQTPIGILNVMRTFAEKMDLTIDALLRMFAQTVCLSESIVQVSALMEMKENIMRYCSSVAPSAFLAKQVSQAFRVLQDSQTKCNLCPCVLTALRRSRTV